MHDGRNKKELNLMDKSGTWFIPYDAKLAEYGPNAYTFAQIAFNCYVTAPIVTLFFIITILVMTRQFIFLTKSTFVKNIFKYVSIMIIDVIFIRTLSYRYVN